MLDVRFGGAGSYVAEKKKNYDVRATDRNNGIIKKWGKALYVRKNLSYAAKELRH